MTTELKLEIMLLVLSYLAIGMFRNHLKAIRLYNEKKVKEAQANFEFFKYTLSHPSIGDVIFFPVQVVLLGIVSIIMLGLKAGFFLLK